jgi:hypothetical protein
VISVWEYARIAPGRGCQAETPHCETPIRVYVRIPGKHGVRRSPDIDSVCEAKTKNCRNAPVVIPRVERNAGEDCIAVEAHKGPGVNGVAVVNEPDRSAGAGPV